MLISPIKYTICFNNCGKIYGKTFQISIAYVKMKRKTLERYSCKKRQEPFRDRLTLHLIVKKLKTFKIRLITANCQT